MAECRDLPLPDHLGHICTVSTGLFVLTVADDEPGSEPLAAANHYADTYVRQLQQGLYPGGFEIRDLASQQLVRRIGLYYSGDSDLCACCLCLCPAEVSRQEYSLWIASAHGDAAVTGDTDPEFPADERFAFPLYLSLTDLAW